MEPAIILIEPAGLFPNNEKLPLIIYPGVIKLNPDEPAGSVENIFRTNGWQGTWRNGIYNFHHYHSTAHEVIGIYKGWVKVQMGGPEGKIMHLKAGDVVIISAGVSHKNLESSTDFACVGAYPPGQNWDMKYGKPDEMESAVKNIKKVALPATDPVFGRENGLLKYWSP
ncbi:MAG: cupin [Cyclobacteriaceae bacterium]|nr:cupin [Cyclobacteriaceae bacterium]